MPNTTRPNIVESDELVNKSLSEFYESTPGQLALMQDEFVDPALVEQQPQYEKSLASHMLRDEKVMSELRKLINVGFDISTLPQLERLRPALAVDMELFNEVLSAAEYEGLISKIVEGMPVEEQEMPQVKHEVPVAVPSKATSEAPAKDVQEVPAETNIAAPSGTAAAISYDDVASAAAEFVEAALDPSRGMAWVNNRLKRKSIEIENAGGNGEAFVEAVRSLIDQYMS